MKLYESSVKKPITTILIFIGVCVFGLFSISRLSVDLMPKIEMNQLTVVTYYNGASAVDVETNVTKVMENVLNTVSDLKKLSSTSKEGVSLISVEFEWGTDLDNAANDIRDKLELAKAALPEGTESPIVFKFSTDMIPVMGLVATAKESLPALYKILEDRLANPLNRINGVGTVSISGAPERQIQVNFDAQKLEAYNLSLEQVGAAIAKENTNLPGGTLRIGSNSIALRVQGELSSSDDLKDLVIGTYNNQLVYLRDVAFVNDAPEKDIQESVTNGTQGAIVYIQKQSGANAVDIANKVKAALPEIQKNLPKDIQLDVLYDTSDFINNSIGSLTETVMFAALFVILVVFIFLGRWRATFIIIMTIPVSLIVGFIYLMISGNTINIISLSSLSIAIGMVVDDAIVVLENITSHIEKGSKARDASIYGTNEVGVAVVASTLTIVAVFFPLTMISGIAGIMFKQLGWMVTIIITVSTLAALSLTPMLSSMMLKKENKDSKLFATLYRPIQKGLDALDRGYAQLLNWAVSHKTVVIVSSFLIFLSSIGLLQTVGTEYFPAADNGQIAISAEMPIGTNMAKTKEVALRISKLVEAYPEMKFVNCVYGSASTSNTWANMSTNGDNIITITIITKDKKDRKRDIYQLSDALRKDLESFPELAKFQVDAGGRRRGSLTSGGSVVDVEISGNSLDVTDRIAEEFSERMKHKVKGLKDVTISREAYRMEYQVEFDREKLALNGLNTATAGQAIRNRMNGMTVSQYREDGDEYNIVLRYAEANRQSIEDIENITIYNNQGMGIRVRDLGKVVERFTPPTIDRQDRERIVKVSGVVYGVPLNQVVEQIEKEMKDIQIPAEIGVEIGGAYKDQQESFADLFLLLLLVIMLVYIVMAAQFESFLYPFIIMLSLPFAFTGVFIALAITGTTLNMTSMIGAIMLVGIVVKNGIVLIDYINLNRERGGSIVSAVVSGGKSRLRPVLMTTLTTILGMIPMALALGEGSEIWSPMAIAIIGGLTFSTILTLIVIPVVYAVFGGNAVRRERKKLAEINGLDD